MQQMSISNRIDSVTYNALDGLTQILSIDSLLFISIISSWIWKIIMYTEMILKWKNNIALYVLCLIWVIKLVWKSTKLFYKILLSAATGNIVMTSPNSIAVIFWELRKSFCFLYWMRRLQKSSKEFSCAFWQRKYCSNFVILSGKSYCFGWVH